jgi:hypothetical protein
MTNNQMTATAILRRMLDERGVAHSDHFLSTTWRDRHGILHLAGEPMADGLLVVDNLTPEQAIAATLDDEYKRGYEDGLHANTKAAFAAAKQAIAATLDNEINGDTSDGYHTFNELYHHRAVLFSVIVRDHQDKAWKARKHHDGTMYDGMFIVGIETPKGQATYHYDIDPYWEMFDCEEREFAPEWDGHTSDDAIARIAELRNNTCKFVVKDNMNESEGMGDVWIECNACHYQFDYYADDWLMKMNYCPNCGARVLPT